MDLSILKRENLNEIILAFITNLVYVYVLYSTIDPSLANAFLVCNLWCPRVNKNKCFYTCSVNFEEHPLNYLSLSHMYARITMASSVLHILT